MTVRNKAAPQEKEQPIEVQTNELTNSLTENAKTVNSLRALRITKQIPVSEIVKKVNVIYPGYDKYLQSKCEHSQYYGVEICKDAMELLVQAYAPEDKKKQKKKDNRTFPCRLSVRVSTQDYESVKKLMEIEGFSTMQDWLYSLIKKYLKE